MLVPLLMFRPVLILLPPSEGKTAARRGKPLDLSGLSVRRSRRPASGCSRHWSRCARATRHRQPPCSTYPRHSSSWSSSTPRCDRADRAGRRGLRRRAVRRARPRVGLGRRPAARDVAGAVISSLFGLLAPTDRIPAYRLSGDAVLPGVGTVAGVWREALGPEIGDLVGNGLLVDLRSGMYAAFWRPAGLPGRRHGPGAARGRRDARSSATSTRRPRAGSSGRCSRTARTRVRRPAWPKRCATWAGTSRWTGREGRGPARRGGQ